MSNMEMERMIDRLLHKVEWVYPEADLYDGGSIAFRNGDETIRGRVALSPRRIEVTLVSPAQGVSENETLDADMPVIFTEHPYETSPASLVGIDRARRLLLKLYCSAGDTTT